MAGTTVPLAFPYPTDGDLVANTDEAIQALAEAVDDYMVGAAAACAAAASVTLPAGNHVYRRGRTVHLALSAWGLTGAKAAGGLLATVPVGYRPLVDAWFVCYNALGTSFNFGVVQPGGSVLIGNAAASGSTFYTSVSYPL